MNAQVQSGVHLMKLEENEVSAPSLVSTGPWKDDREQLKQCWTKPVSTKTNSCSFNETLQSAYLSQQNCSKLHYNDGRISYLSYTGPLD